MERLPDSSEAVEASKELSENNLELFDNYDSFMTRLCSGTGLTSELILSVLGKENVDPSIGTKWVIQDESDNPNLPKRNWYQKAFFIQIQTEPNRGWKFALVETILDEWTVKELIDPQERAELYSRQKIENALEGDVVMGADLAGRIYFGAEYLRR